MQVLALFPSSMYLFTCVNKWVNVNLAIKKNSKEGLYLGFFNLLLQYITFSL